jgi:hypothetical protein
MSVLALGMIIFVASKVYAPVFSGNQNTYFIHGLSNVGGNRLANDFLSVSADHVPVFSAFITAISAVLPPVSFQILHAAMLGIYFISVVGIARHLFSSYHKTVPLVLLVAILVGFQSPWLASLVPNSLVTLQNNLWGKGLAGQTTMSSSLEPATAGIFLFFSLLALIQTRYVTAGLFLVIPALIHPSYLVISSFLAIGYILALLRDRSSLRSAAIVVLISGSGLILVSSYLLWGYLQSSQEVNSEAARILVNDRLPHHALPKIWFGRGDIVQLVVVALAWFIVRKTILGTVIGISTSLALLFSGVQLITGSETIALLFPWRISVILVPLSSVVITAYAIDFITTRGLLGQFSFSRVSKYVLITAAFILAGVIVFYAMGESRDKNVLANAFPHAGVANYLDESEINDLSIMIPPKRWTPLDNFRLDAMVPVFVDQKNHPIFGEDVVEWDRRLKVARDVYSNLDKGRCDVVKGLLAGEYVTHILVLVGSGIQNCGSWVDEYIDESYKLIRVE